MEKQMHDYDKLMGQFLLLQEKYDSAMMKVNELSEKNLILEATFSLYKMKLFGKSAEKIDPNQLYLLNEAEKTANEEGETDSEAEGETVSVEGHDRKRGKRSKLPESLPRIEIVHDLPEGDKVCLIHGEMMVVIGEEVSEQLDLIPAKIQVLKHIRPKYKCPCCEGGIKIASMPVQIIPKSNAGPGLLSHLIVGKYQDHLPLYRQEGILNRLGMDLSRGTVARWLIQVADRMRPLFNLMKEDLLNLNYVHCDETHVQVLKEKGRDPTSKSYMWVLCSGPPGKEIIIYNYEPSRSGKTAKGLLEGFKGYLQTDGYQGYDIVSREEKEITHIACWAHVRRKFYEAVMAIPEKKRKTSGSIALEGWEYIKTLYKFEGTYCEGKNPEEVKMMRAQYHQPLLDEMKKWLDEKVNQVPPKMPTGKALHYMEGLWKKLTVFLEDGRIRLDNNKVENKIRPFVVGRKNWLFADTPKGAEASSIYFSLIETAKASGHEAYFYIKYLLQELPKAKEVGDFEKLLPYNLSPQKGP